MLVPEGDCRVPCNTRLAAMFGGQGYKQGYRFIPAGPFPFVGRVIEGERG